MELQPTRSEARRIVVSVCVFWLSFVVIGPATSDESQPAYLAPLFFGAMFAVLFFYWNVYKVAARELDRSIWSFFGPFGRRGSGYFKRAREDYRVLFKIVDPRWWHRRVAPATDWPVLLVDAVVLGSLILLVVFAMPATFRTNPS